MAVKIAKANAEATAIAEPKETSKTNLIGFTIPEEYEEEDDDEEIL